jgi:hypothetical protein
VGPEGHSRFPTVGGVPESFLRRAAEKRRGISVSRGTVQSLLKIESDQ